MTSFWLKIIAAVTMFIDHMGMILFPGQIIFRVIGRLAFPIYAYCIAEGFRYTKDRVKYFLRIFILGVLCQIVYTIVERDIYLGILLTFSLSMILMALQEKCIRGLRRREYRFCAVYIISVAAVFLLTCVIHVDYGFVGVMLPVLAALFPDKTRRLLAFAVGLTALSFAQYKMGSTTQIVCLLALVPLALYNGKPGKYRLKYFFYIFYPAHLVLLYAMGFLMR
ncbi:MAG: hypothetical protein E7638_04210 [Ruminococcaceae bacterium]|nr:hypothetical protein [Oscillospiraceae bacterium]